MTTVVLKWFAGQGTGWTDGQTEEAATISFQKKKHNKSQRVCKFVYLVCLYKSTTWTKHIKTIWTLFKQNTNTNWSKTKHEQTQTNYPKHIDHNKFGNV